MVWTRSKSQALLLANAASHLQEKMHKKVKKLQKFYDKYSKSIARSKTTAFLYVFSWKNDFFLELFSKHTSDDDTLVLGQNI